jgi:hypothetical protein
MGFSLQCAVRQNPIPARFLAPIDCYKIPAQVSTLPAQLVSIQVISSVPGFNHGFSLVHSPIKCKCRICLSVLELQFMYVRTW